MVTNQSKVLTDHQVVPAEIHQRQIQVEVVLTPESMTQGLSGRNQIGSDGMFFILGSTRYPQFWMKDMLFDLDLVWLLDNKIVDITKGVPKPAPGTRDQQLTTYSPQVQANQVLEIPAGTADQWGLVIGDQLEIK